MKTLLISLVLFVFLTPPVLSQNVGVQSENWIYVPFSLTVLDTNNTFSSLLEGTQIFSIYGYTIPGTIYGGGWSVLTTWRKRFEDYPVIPDTFAVDLRVNAQTNLLDARIGIAMQDSFYYGSDISQPFVFNGEWQTLKFETSLFKSFLNNFIKFYFVFLLVSEDSCYIGTVVEVDNFRGIDDTLGVIMYDDFDYPSLVTIIEQNLTDFVLEQNYPNPFNPSTTIRFSVPRLEYVNITVFNSIGEQIAVLVSEEMGIGTYETTFDASRLSSGAYFYRITTGDYVEIKKMVFLK